MVNIKTVNTILYCNRFKETVAFYRTHLGLPETISEDWFVEFNLSGSSRLSIADAARTSMDSSAGKGITITIEVDDVEAVHLFLNKAGLNPPPIKKHAWLARIIHIYDPEGNRLEFWAPDMESDKTD